MDKAKIEKAVRDILEAIGEDPDREGLIEPKDLTLSQVTFTLLTTADTESVWLIPR